MGKIRYYLNEKEINLADGKATESLTGDVIGIDSATQTKVDEIEYLNGRVVSRKSYEGEGNLVWSRKWDKDSRPLSESYYSEVGRLAIFHREFDQGRLRVLVCSSENPPPEFADVCGFTPERKTIEIFNFDGEVIEKRNYVQGKITKQDFFQGGLRIQSDSFQGDLKTTEVFYPTGKIKNKFQVKSISEWDFLHHGLEEDYSEEGVVLSSAHWTEGKIQSVKEFFMNGKPSAHVTKIEGERFSVEMFYDTGELLARGFGEFSSPFKPCSKFNLERLLYVGKRETFYKNSKVKDVCGFKEGKLNGDANMFNESGELIFKYIYESGDLISRLQLEKGKVILEETYHKDGSLKEKKV